MFSGFHRANDCFIILGLIHTLDGYDEGYDPVIMPAAKIC